MRKVAIIQSSYVPWKGCFDIINTADVFVFLDDVQYTVRDWRNRNRIKTLSGGSQWLSVPVLGGRDQLIQETRIDHSQRWARKHLEALRHNYGKAPHFDRYFPSLKDAYEAAPECLSVFNQHLIQMICGWLGIETEFADSKDLACAGSRDDKLLALIQAVDGEHYISGPSAKSYIDPGKFAALGIGLEYADYSRYPEYPQISEPFEHAVSVLDLLFMKGPDAPSYIWGRAGA
jgi:hypothetical protein